MNQAEQIVLGHNAFFGVDHLSASRGQERAAYFANAQRIVDAIQFARQNNVRGLMLSTHARAVDVLALLKKDSSIVDTLRIYPLLPYVQKYVIAANHKGMLNVIFDSVSGATGAEKLKMLWNGAKGVLGKDMRAVLRNLIQVELLPFRDFHTPHIFLHDAFTDIALALDLKNIFEFYIEEIAKTYKAEAAFTTKNLPFFLTKFKQYGLGTPLVMTHVNKLGFSMNPSREAVEEALQKQPARIMAMSTLASGHLPPATAFEYLGKIPGIESIVVGASSPDHIEETVSAIREHVFLTKPSLRTVA